MRDRALILPPRTVLVACRRERRRCRTPAQCRPCGGAWWWLRQFLRLVLMRQSLSRCMALRGAEAPRSRHRTLLQAGIPSGRRLVAEGLDGLQDLAPGLFVDRLALDDRRHGGGTHTNVLGHVTLSNSTLSLVGSDLDVVACPAHGDSWPPASAAPGADHSTVDALFQATLFGFEAGKHAGDLWLLVEDPRPAVVEYRAGAANGPGLVGMLWQGHEVDPEAYGPCPPRIVG